MTELMETSNRTFELGPGPGKAGSILDIAIYVAAGVGFFAIEEWFRATDRFPFPAPFDGAFALIAAFFVAVALMKWRGQRWSDLGLRRPERRWSIPVWGFVVLVVNILAQITVVPVLAKLLGVGQPDLSRYDVIYQNFPMFLVVASGAMITGGFMEEFVYRGLMIDRLGRIFGEGRRGLILAALLNGLPFGLIHFEWGIGGMLVTTVMGSVLGLMYLATKRNLWPLIAAHATLDLILMLQMYLGSAT